MKKLLFLVFLIINLVTFSQEDRFYRVVDWQFYPDSVVQLTDSTYILKAIPIDYGDPGAINRTIGNYITDFVGHRYAIIDSTSTTITVYDYRKEGVAPQSYQIARCYRSVGNGEAEFIGSVNYSTLDESARWKLNGSDNELLWRKLKSKKLVELYDVDTTLVPLTTTGQFPVWDNANNYFDFDYKLWGIDTGLIQSKAYDSTWDGLDSVAPSKNAVYDILNSMSHISYCPTTMTVNMGTLNTGTAADLCAVGGTDVNISELNGLDPLRVTFGFTAVDRMNYFTFYGDYSGGADHVVWVEIYNPNTTNWDFLGLFGTSAVKQWYSFPVFTPNTYISSGSVQVRINHQGSGVSSHALILDYVDVNYGGGGGGGGANITASTVTYIPNGNISSTNVQTAIAELDSEKAPVQQFHEISVSSDGLSSFTIPFTISSVSSIFINNVKIPSSLWSGVNSTTLTINVQLKLYDFITITKN